MRVWFPVVAMVALHGCVPTGSGHQAGQVRVPCDGEDGGLTPVDEDGRPCYEDRFNDDADFVTDPPYTRRGPGAQGGRPANYEYWASLVLDHIPGADRSEAEFLITSSGLASTRPGFLRIDDIRLEIAGTDSWRERACNTLPPFAFSGPQLDYVDFDPGCRFIVAQGPALPVVLKQDESIPIRVWYFPLNDPPAVSTRLVIVTNAKEKQNVFVSLTAEPPRPFNANSAALR